MLANMDGNQRRSIVALSTQLQRSEEKIESQNGAVGTLGLLDKTLGA